MRKRRLLYMIGILLLLLCMLGGCTLGNGEKTSKKKEADYLIGVVKENAPYYYEEKDGGPKGYYVDFISALSKKYSFTYEFVSVESSSCKKNLSDKMIDAFIGTSVTEVGEKNSFFESESFYTSKICVLSAPDSKIHNLKEIKRKKLVAISGTEEEVAAKYLANKYKGQSIAFSSIKEALNDVKEGYSQILVIDKEYYKSHEEDFKGWTYLKQMQQFQNSHKLFTLNNNLVH